MRELTLLKLAIHFAWILELHFFSILNVSIHDSAVHHFDMNESYLTNIILVQFKTEKSNLNEHIY